MSGTFKDLRVWQQAMALAVEIYRVTSTFPKSELYGLTAQLRRAAVSVPSNIAEGKGRHSDREALHFFHNARGSLYELETQLLLARELEYVSSDAARQVLGTVAAVAGSLTGLINAFAQGLAAAAE